jgi:hypothetical protein
MERSVRELLHAMAEEVPGHGSLPPPTKRRARRHMAATALAAAVVIALASSALVVGVQAMRGPVTPRPATVRSCEWTRIPSPNQDPAAFTNRLDSLTAVADDDVWAVGGYYHAAGEGSGPERPLALHWDGSAWSNVPLPDEAGFDGLPAVAAVSPTDVWAVGSVSVEEGDRPLALHWDGARWSVVPTPDPGKTYSRLRAVAAAATDDVWAVGSWATGHGDAGTLTMHWDGAAWAIVPSPDVPPRPQVGWSYPGLSAVVALSGDNAWAVGTSTNVAPTGPRNTLVLHWDGAEWSAVPSPDIPAPSGLPYNSLGSVDGASPDDLWAVGSYESDLNDDPYSFLPERTLAMHWDGGEWSVVPTPVLEGRNTLSQVVSLSADEAWAVGSAQEQGTWRVLVERWDGSAWSIESVPVDEEAWLSAVAATPSGELWAVGSASVPGQEQWGTLVLHAECG